jgi:anti-sigma B factor antagonist
MQIQDEKIGGVLVVKPLEKRLDAHVAVDLKEKMAFFVNNGNDLIVLDLAGVDFIDSSGLGAIVSSLKVLGRKGDLAICGIHETVMSMFRLTRMDRVFRIFPNRDEAVTALST